MKKLIVIATALAAAALSAKGTFNVAVDHADAVYSCGEKAVFTVKAVGDGGAPITNGFVTAALDNFGSRKIVERRIDLSKENPFRLEGTLDKPGFLRARLSGAGCEGRVFGVGFSPEGIRPGAPNPPDFDAFWADAVKRLDETVPVDARLELVPEKSKGPCNYYRVSFATYGGRRVYGWLSEPKDLTRKWPVRLSVPGAGIGASGTGSGAGAIFLTMNVHSYQQPETTQEERKARYDAQDAQYAKPNGVARYCQAGIHKSREDYFYYASILGINRAVNWLAARPECDLSDFSYSGTSQGGGFGLYLCGLNKHITKGCIFVPAITDLLGDVVDGRQSGWPRIIEAQKAENRAAAAKNAPYFDAANFARRITIPVRVVVGFADQTCAPCAVYAGYNVIPSKDKKILHGIGMGHGVNREFYQRLAAWQNAK